MRVVLAVLTAAAVAACGAKGSGHGPPSPGDAGPTGDGGSHTDAGSGAPDGGTGPDGGATSPYFTVHATRGIPPNGSGSIHVLLGQGSKYDLAVDQNGDAVFTDPAIVPPQDVTVVIQDSTGLHVETWLAVPVKDVWPPLRLATPPNTTTLGTVSGTLTGAASSSDDFSVTAVGPGKIYGYYSATGTSYSEYIDGVQPAPFPMVAVEYDPIASANVKAGAARGVTLTNGAATENIALDHAFSTTATLTVNGAAPWGSASPEIDLNLDGFDLFSQSNQGMSPPVTYMCPMVTFDGTFSGARLDAIVTAGTTDPPLGNGETRILLATGVTTATVSLPAPFQITSPQIGTPSNATTVSRSGLTMTWSEDPATTFFFVDFGGGQFEWSVIGPGGVTSFTPFALPQDAATSPIFPAGPYSVLSLSTTNGNYADVFGQNGPPPLSPDIEVRTTEVDGAVNLQ